MKSYLMKSFAGVLLMITACGCTTEQAELHPERTPHLTQGRIQFESSTTKNIVTVKAWERELGDQTPQQKKLCRLFELTQRGYRPGC